MMRYFALLLFATMLALPVQAQVTERFEEKSNKKTEETVDEEESTEPPKKRTADELVRNNDSSKFWDNIVLGGGLSLSFGTYTSIYLAPAVGYRVSEKLVMGPGFVYQYFRSRAYYDPASGQLILGDPYSDQIYGPTAFVNYSPFDKLYLGSQFEYLNHDYRIQQLRGAPEVENRWTPVLFLEGGFRSKIGRKGYAYVGLRYNILHDHTSPYASAWFPAIGFMF